MRKYKLTDETVSGGARVSSQASVYGAAEVGDRAMVSGAIGR